MLHAVLALTGEGEVPGPALSRSLVATWRVLARCGKRYLRDAKGMKNRRVTSGASEVNLR